MVRFNYVFIALFVISFIACRKRNYIKDETGWSRVTVNENPGWLKFYQYIPENVASNPALIVVLHGCTQNAEEIAYTAGWNDLADQYGFVVLYPQQRTTNNTSRCFNWFLGMDNERGKGEAESIANATKELMDIYTIDTQKVFVTGVSAGAGMTNILLACYPELYKAGAPYAGPPYKIAKGFSESTKALTGKIDKTPEEWKNLVLKATDYSGEYPRVCILQGDADNVNHPNNSAECEEQWLAVHGIENEQPQISTSFNGNNQVTHRVFTNSTGDTLVQHYQLKGLGHKIAIDPGTGTQHGGYENFYVKDFNFHSTYWIVDFFGVDK